MHTVLAPLRRPAALRGRAVAGVAGLAAGLLTGLAAASGTGGSTGGSTGGGTALTVVQAEFLADDMLQPLQVALPDTWVLRGRPTAGVGHYRVRFTLPAVVDVAWALQADRLSTAHEVRLNGQLVHGTLRIPPQAMRPVQTLIALPPHLLQAGDNQLDIAIEARVGGGLSALTLGPTIDLAAGFQRQLLRTVGLPQWLNVAGAAISLFMLLLWLKRRRETVLGSLGALGLLVSLRNVTYFEANAALPGPWAAWAGWLYMLAQLATTLLLGAFAMAFAERRPLAYRRALQATALLFPLLSLWALWADALQLARLWLYPWALLLNLFAAGLVAHAAWQRRIAAEIVLAASLTSVMAAGFHDYFLQQGRLSVMGTFWVPYAVPLLLAAFSALLLKRLLLERTRELQAANAAKTRFLAAASHDLRQPMVSIGLLVGLMHEQVVSGPLRRVVLRLQEATGAMEALLTRLLDLSRLQAGTVRSFAAPVLRPRKTRPPAWGWAWPSCNARPNCWARR